MAAQDEDTTSRFRPMMSFQNVIINGGNFIQHNSAYERKSSFEILKDNVTDSAFHNSFTRFDPPKCHRNTRVAVLEKIMDWVRRTDWETWYRYIMWLTGAAGAGKSAIAQSIIELCLSEGLIIASFFFFRSDGTRNHGKSLVSTLAYQIYFSVPTTQEEILSAIAKDPLIFTRNLDHQFDALVIQPLRKFYEPLDTLDENLRRLIVIDGLDECLDHDTQKQILNMIRSAIRKYELPIIFLIASRPEHDITTVFNSKALDGVYTRLYLDDSFHPDEDIYTFLKDSFEEIKTNHPFKARIPVLWPPPEAIASIVQKSSGQFIYAATIIRYVQSIRHQPHHRLDIIMNLRPAKGDLPFAQLDGLYKMILCSAEDIDRVLNALSIYSLHVVKDDDLDVSAFMGLEEGELDILFCDLGALVSVDWIKRSKTEGTQMLRILHASLHDFLLDPARADEYFINIDTYRMEHLANILRYLTSSRELHVMNQRAWSVSAFFGENIPLCQSSTELMNEASSFPLRRVLKAALRNSMYNLIYFVFLGFLPFLRHMARLDQQWSLIETRQHKALDKIFLSLVPFYYSNPYLTSFLCLICHMGKEIWVPCVRVDYGHDMLGLQHLDLQNVGTDRDQYRQCLIRFLQEPNRSGRYSIGVEEYINATIYFIEQLSQKKGMDKEGPFDEHWLSDRLTLDNDIWRFKRADLFNSPSVDCFIYLGYIIFFLPRSAECGQLVRHCQQPTFLTESLMILFPTRITLVQQAMKDYLESVESRTSEELDQVINTE